MYSNKRYTNAIFNCFGKGCVYKVDTLKRSDSYPRWDSAGLLHTNHKSNVKLTNDLFLGTCCWYFSDFSKLGH